MLIIFYKKSYCTGIPSRGLSAVAPSERIDPRERNLETYPTSQKFLRFGSTEGARVSIGRRWKQGADRERTSIHIGTARVLRHICVRRRHRCGTRTYVKQSPLQTFCREGARASIWKGSRKTVFRFSIPFLSDNG